MALLGSLLALATGATAAPPPVQLDAALRHIGDNRYGPQCGVEQFGRLGAWGDRYAIEFRTAAPGRFRVRIERAWGAAPSFAGSQSSVDTVLVDGQPIGALAVSQDPARGCGAAWTSEPFELGPGRHVLTIVSGPLRDGIDDVAFQGVALLAAGSGTAVSYGRGRVRTGESEALPREWLEVLMETTTLLATFAILAFLAERLTNGIALVLGYWRWWRERLEIPPLGHPETQARNERNRRVALFAISAILAVIGALVVKLDILAKLGLAGESTAGYVVTGLLIASGADPIREALRSRERGREDGHAPRPIQLSGTLVVQQTAPPPPPARSEG